MPPRTPQFNYSKRPVRKLRLPKLGPPKSQSLFEEYFYGFLVIIFVAVAILLKAGGMKAYDAIVVGLWATGFSWFVRQLKLYLKHRANPEPVKKPTQAAAKTQPQVANGLPPGMKPMIGPQWPLKTVPGAARPAKRSVRPAQESVKPAQGQIEPAQTLGPAGQAPGTPGNPNKPLFVYERPTLPGRKPKLPNNWPGRQDKKPKR